MGRQKKYSSNAEKQKAYRQRKLNNNVTENITEQDNNVTNNVTLNEEKVAKEKIVLQKRVAPSNYEFNVHRALEKYDKRLLRFINNSHITRIARALYLYENIGDES